MDLEVNIIFILNIFKLSTEFFKGEYSLRLYINDILRMCIKT